MTLLDFELHMRPAKVAKARGMYQKGQVLDLHQAAVMYVAKMKIGAYKTQVAIDGLKIGGSRCNCDAQRTRYCEHSVAVLFAIRAAAGLKPILASAVPKLNYAEGPLAAMLRVFNDPDYEISKADVALFGSTARKLTGSMEEAFHKNEFEEAATLGLAIATCTGELEMYLNHDYSDYEAITEPVFGWLEKIFFYAPETIQEELFHDVRIEAVRGYSKIGNGHKTWFDVLLAGANNPVRKDQFIRTMNALCILVEGSANEYSVPVFKRLFIEYRDRLSA